MCQVKGYCNDGKVYFCLNADQAFDYTRWSPPINWGGSIAGIPVKFTQTDSGAYGLDDFDWEDFPSDLDEFRDCIIKAIDDAMRVMD